MMQRVGQKFTIDGILEEIGEMRVVYDRGIGGMVDDVQMGTRQVGHARRSRKFPPFSQQQINELFNEYYCYDLQHTELKLLHHIL